MRSPGQNTRRPQQRRRGSALIEFTLVGTFIFLPMLAGLATVGMNMVTAMQVENLTASAGQMFSAGWDFTNPTNVSMLRAMAGTLQTSSTGSGVVILSEVQYTSNGLVCSNQITTVIGSAGYTGTSQYCAGGAVTAAFTALMPMTVVGQTAYVAESYYNNPQFAWALAPAGTSTGIYQKAIF
ncbi:MAG: hypothetical protein ABSB15_14805 [Bryobacteraceae bacterium]|jgi:hypothetical protein